jgi:hypothetical protein
VKNLDISESVFSTSFRTNWIIMIIFLGLDLSSKNMDQVKRTSV